MSADLPCGGKGVQIIAVNRVVAEMALHKALELNSIALSFCSALHLLCCCGGGYGFEGEGFTLTLPLCLFSLFQ